MLNKELLNNLGLETMEAPAEETEVIKKAKYKVKNDQGKYDTVYLETSADQVIESADKKFVTQQEKAKIGQLETALTAETQQRTEADKQINAKIDIINGNAEQAGSINKALKDAKAYTDSKITEINVGNQVNTAKEQAIQASKDYTNTKVEDITAAYTAADEQVKSQAAQTAQQKADAVKNELNPRLSAVEGKASTNEAGINEIKGLLAKNTTAYVAPNIAGIATVASNPKKGDIVYVVDIKRAYIFKGVETPEGDPSLFEAPAEEGIPAGWVLLDDIKTNVDLSSYLQKTEAESTYVKKTDKIAEENLHDNLKNKINGKLDTSALEGKINEKVNPVNEKVTALEGKVEGKLDKTAVAGEVNKIVEPIKNELNTKIDTKLDGTAVDQKIDAKLNPVKNNLNSRIDGLVPTVGGEAAPQGKATGHVWLDTTGHQA